MLVKVSWEDGEENLEMEEGAIVEDVFGRIQVNPETVIVELDGQVVSLDEELDDGDGIRLLNVVSGG